MAEGQGENQLTQWMRQHKVWTAVGVVVLLAAFGLAVGEEEETPNPTAVAADTEAPETPVPTPDPTPNPTPEPRPSLGFTTEDFRNRWNATAEDVGTTEFTIASVNIEDGDVQDVWQHQVQPNIFMQGAVNKVSGEVNEITVIASPEDDQTSTDILLTWGTLVATLSPELDVDGRGQVFRDLRIVDGPDDFSDLDERTTRGDVEYHVMGVPELGGIMFVASPA